MTFCLGAAVLHLAATMGKPTWVLTPKRSDWKWVMLDLNPRTEDGYESSVWYPHMWLYRQTDSISWESPIARVCSYLEAHKP